MYFSFFILFGIKEGDMSLSTADHFEVVFNKFESNQNFMVSRTLFFP